MPALVDLHNHLIPRVDDGARDESESTTGLQSLREAGVRVVVTTPHVDASVLGRGDLAERRLGQLDAAWDVLCRVAAASAPDVELHRGAEIMLDLPVLNLEDPRVRLAGGAYVLVEFPHPNVPPNTAGALARIRESGAIPIVAHPERYAEVRADPRFALMWRGAGAYLQLNGASLLGWYGKSARTAAIELLREGAFAYVASDFHCRGRCPVKLYEPLLRQFGGDRFADLLLSENPGRILRGEPLLEAPPLTTKAPLWRRVIALLR